MTTEQTVASAQSRALEAIKLTNGLKDALTCLNEGNFEAAANLIRQLAASLPPPKVLTKQETSKRGQK